MEKGAIAFLHAIPEIVENVAVALRAARMMRLVVSPVPASIMPMTATTHTIRMGELSFEELRLDVPLAWDDPADGREITVFARIVTRAGGEQLPYLVFLQGGPGYESPRPAAPPVHPSWIDHALEHYRVVLLDQRGTGLSTPVGPELLEGRPAAEVAEYLTHLRADSIVRDCEAIREHLGAERWNTLGQSFGGFTTLRYLSAAPASIDTAYITGGLSAVGRPADEIYRLCYDKMRAASEAYYRRFPADRDRVRELAELAAAGGITLPDGEVVSVSRLRSLGHLLGSDDGWPSLRWLLERDPASSAFRHDLAALLPYGARNPLYAVIHESSYADGCVTGWSAERVMPQDFRDDPALLTGEHVAREWFETVPGLRPWREVAELIAEHEWPRLYDADAIAASGVRGAAAVYVNDVFVPLEFSLETGALMPGMHLHVTSEHEHSGLRTGAVLPRLIDLAHGRRLR